VKLNDAVARIKELQGLMHTAADQAAASAQRYEAHMTLYNVACASNDSKLIDEERLTLHSALDSILDSGFTIATHKRELDSIMRGPIEE
jgi:hypothetical protein